MDVSIYDASFIIYMFMYICQFRGCGAYQSEKYMYICSEKVCDTGARYLSVSDIRKMGAIDFINVFN